MKIGYIKYNNEKKLAAFYGEDWVELSGALPLSGEETAKTLEEFIKLYSERVPEVNDKIKALYESGKLSELAHPQKDAMFLPPIPEVPKLFTGRGNSACFTRVTKGAVCRQPVLEQRYNFNLTGHNFHEARYADFVSSGWNYEMIAVFAKPCHDVTVEEAEEYIFGYTNMLEHALGYKNYPFREGNVWASPDSEKVFADWAYEGCYNGNNHGHTPIGPWIVTKDEVGDPHEQTMLERESGRLVSYGFASACVFTINEIIAYMSSFMTFYPGDMVNTASITYDGYQSMDPLPEKAYIEAKVEKIGTLRNWIDDRTDRKYETIVTGPGSTMLIDLNSEEAFADRGDPVRKYPRLLPVPKQTIAAGTELKLPYWRKNLKMYPQLYFVMDSDALMDSDNGAEGSVKGVGIGLAFSDDGILMASKKPSARDAHMCYWYSLYSDDSQVLSDELKKVPDARDIKLTISSETLGTHVFDQKNLLFTPEEAVKEGGRCASFAKGDIVSLGAAGKPVSVPCDKKFREGEVITVSAEGFKPLKITVTDERDPERVMPGWSPRPFFLEPEYNEFR